MAELYCPPFTLTTTGYTAGSGTLAVSAAAPVAIQSGTFRVRLGNASNTVLKVTAGASTTTWTVVAEFSDANASSGTTVYGCEFSPGALTQVLADNTLYTGFASATAVKGNYVVTLGSIPTAGSVLLFADGILKPSTSYTVSGSTATLTLGLSAGVVITAVWSTHSSTPGSITLSGVLLTQAALRGTSALFASSANSYNVPYPAGTVSGDFAVIVGGHGFAFSTPSGWTQNDVLTGSNWNGAVFSKILTNADLVSGSVIVSAAGSFDGVVGMATFVGATGGIRELPSQRNGTGSSSISLSTDSSVASTDAALYFGSNRGGSTDTVNRGVQQRQANDGASASGCLYFEQFASAGAVSATFSYSAAGIGNYQAIVVIQAG